MFELAPLVFIRIPGINWMRQNGIPKRFLVNSQKVQPVIDKCTSIPKALIFYSDVLSINFTW